MKSFHRNILLVFILLLLINCNKTKYTVAENFNQFGTIFGKGEEHSIAEVLKTNDDNYIICGTVNGGANGMYDGFVMKVDEHFNVIWYKNYGGRKEDYFKSMAIDEQGNILLAGNSNSFGVSLDTSRIDLNPLFYLVYINNMGEKIWEKTHQANDTTKNQSNEAEKVLYLNNGTFSISGETKNFLGVVNGMDVSSDDYYIFCVDKQGNLIWNNRYYLNHYTDMNRPWSNYCQEASLCEDGNIQLQFKSINDLSTSYDITLAKIAYSSSGFAVNRYIRKSKLIPNLSNSDFNFSAKIPMASIVSDKVVMADLINKGIVFTNDLGAIIKRTSFKYPVLNMNIYTENNKVIITGSYQSSLGNFPCWVITDSIGNILEENYLKFESKFSDKIHFNKIILNKNNEVIVFGSVETDKGSNIIMLRYDYNGNLLK